VVSLHFHAAASALLAAIALLLPSTPLAQEVPELEEGTEKWYLERGRTNMEIGNYKAAIEAYQKAATLDPDNREAMKQLGVAYEKQGLTTEAIKQFDRYLERFQDDPEIAFRQADYLGWSRFDYRRVDAIRYYRMGLERREDAERRHKLAQLLAQDRAQLEEALEQYRALLEAQPENTTWRDEYRKLLLWDERHLQEAVQEQRRLAGKHPKDLDVQHTLAQLLTRENPRSDEALSLYTDLVKRRPEDAALRLEYADLLATRERRSAAIGEYRIVLAGDPKPATRHKLARLLAQDRAQLDDAIEQYRALLEADPENATWRDEYRKLLLWDEAHLADAVREQRRLAAEQPQDFDVQHTLAKLLARQDSRSDEAVSIYADLLRQRPAEAGLRLEYADLLAGDRERRSDAIKEYRTVLAADPRSATRYKLARLLGQDRAQLDEALEEYRILVDAEPENPEWRREYRQLLLWDDRHLGKAVQEQQRLAAERPGDFDVQHTLAQLLAREKPGSAEALSLYADLVKRRPADTGLRLEYADLLSADETSRVAAIEQYREIVASDPQPETRHKLARLLAADRAQVDEALEQYRLLLESQPTGQPENQEWRAEFRKVLLWDERNAKEAISEYRRYAAEKPGEFEVHHTLAKLLARDDPSSGEAVSLYRGLVAARPSDQALRAEYAALLSADPERRTEAIQEYRILVDAEPTPETREALADLLSGRSDGRAQALELYEVLTREKPDDVELRIKYARLLAGRREDTRRAIDQYEIAVQHDPRSAAAHAGLAAGYAALRDRDRALQHSNLAVEYGAQDDELYALRKDLLRGREPSLQAFAQGFVQRGDSKSKLNGAAGGLGGRVDAGTALTLGAQGGGEEYWSGGHEAAGAFARADTDLRIDPENEIGVGVGYHTLGERSILGHLEYKLRGDSWKLGLGGERSLRYDSYVALVGDSVDGRTIGSARENRFHLLARYEGRRATLSLEPYGGFVDASGVAANPFVGGRVELRYRIFDGEGLQISPILAGEVFHYRFNAFGVNLDPGEPEPGGYFSPQFFGSGEPGLALTARLGENHFLELEGGPAVQYVNEQGTKHDLGLGGQGRFEYVYFLRPSIYWSIGAEVQSFGAAFTRATATSRLAFRF